MALPLAKHLVKRYSYESKDCAVRAMSCALGFSYRTTHRIMATLGRHPREGTPDSYIAFILQDMLGYTPIYPTGPMRLLRFIRGHQGGTYIIRITNHLTTLVDGKLYESPAGWEKHKLRWVRCWWEVK